MPTLVNAHYVDSDITGSSSGVDAWTADTELDGTYYSVAFDAGDSSLPVLANDALTISAPAPANDFSADTNCMALWKFDDGALGADSKGGNTLTVNGGTADTSVYKEGDASVNLTGIAADYLSITNANLDAGYPFKSTDADQKISVAAWVRFDTIANNDTWYSVYDTGANKRTLMLTVFDNTGFKFVAYLGKTLGTAAEFAYCTTVTPVVDQWYHVVFTYDDTTRGWNWRVYDQTADAIYVDSGTAGQDINIEDSDVRIGRYSAAGYFDGRIDELVVFKDVLTADEIDEIRSGTYGAVADTRSGVCYSCAYDDSATGTIIYSLDTGSDPFVDDDTVSGDASTIDINGTPAVVSVVSEQARTTAHPANHAHIEGQSVDVLDDGVVVENSTITSGIVSPAVTGTTHQGLNFVSLLKPSKLNLEQMGWVIVKNITKLIVSFLYTLKGKCGTNNIERPTSLAEMETVAFGTELFTGIKEVPVYGGYEREGDLIIKQDEPLPMICRGVIIDLGAYDT